MDKDFNTSSSHVLHLASLDLSLLYGFEDGVDERTSLGRRTCGASVRKFGDGKSLAVTLFYLGTNAHRTATLTIIVLRDINAAACLEVRIELERLII